MLRIRDIMTRDVAVVSPQTTLREAMELFARHHVSGAPVVSGATVVGIVSTADLLAFASTLRGVPSVRSDVFVDVEFEMESGPGDDELGDEPDSPGSAFFSELWDDAGAEVTERFSAIEGPEWNALEEHDVSEVMTRDLYTLTSDAPAAAAADLMRERGIHRIIIVDRGELVGIVSALDIATAVADRRFTTRTYVFNHDHEFGSAG